MQDVLGHIPDISSRAMFGGYGIYKEGIIFAIIAYDELYFKVGDSNIKDYQDLDSHPFVYEGKNNKKTAMSYWLLPDEIMSEREEIIKWVDKAVKVSKQKKK